jgi:hypothetical protein
VTNRIASLISLLFTIAVGCGLPARDFSDYLAKATEAADQAISEAETALLAGDLWLGARLLQNSVAVQLEDAEKAAGDALDGFASVLPPDRPSEALRAELVPMLHETADLIAAMRFAVRHGDLARFRQARDALDDSARRLESWAGQHE